MDVGSLQTKTQLVLVYWLSFGIAVFFGGMMVWGRHESMLASHYVILLPVLLLVFVDYRRIPLAFEGTASKVFLAFLLLSVGRAVIEDDSRESWFVIKNCLILLAVFIGLRYINLRSVTLSGRVIGVIGGVGFIVMLLTLEKYLSVPSGFGHRLKGEGILTNPLYAGLVFGMWSACFVGMLCLLEGAPLKIFSFVAASIGALLLLATKGKGVYLAMLVAVLPVLIVSSSRGRWLIASLGLLVAGGLFFFGLLEDVFSRGWGDEWRVKIWLDAWEIILQSPMLGEGLSRQVDVEVLGHVWNHSHNLIIDAARLAGLPVAIAFSLLIICVLWESFWKMGKAELIVAGGLLFSVVALMTNGRFPLMGRFDAHWVAFWFPLLWLLSRSQHRFSFAGAGERSKS